MQTLRDIMTTNCVTVSSQDTLNSAAQKMKQHNIGIIPVVEGNNLVGVVTDRDLAIRGYGEQKTGAEPVSQVMSTNVTTASPDMTTEEAAKLMARQQIRRLPVVENGQLAGIVAIGDLAVRKEDDAKAGKALSEISEPARPMM